MFLSNAKKIQMYRDMIKIRFFENKVFELYGQNLVPGTIHLYAGEEAVAVGTCANLRKEDYIVSTHRGHGHCIAKGASLDLTMAEILGRSTGYCKGKGGSMHIADFTIGMLGATAVVGAGLPIATGAGLSIKLRGTDQVAACFFGDGASNQGTFHEAINMAAIWNLPVLFVCENNLYAMGTRQSQVMLLDQVADRAPAYGIPGISINGNNVLDVYTATAEACKRARTGEGPSLIECRTYRHKGHSRWDPATYRPREEVAEWLARDPIQQMKKHLLDQGIISEPETTKIEEETAAAVEKAVKFAIDSPFPVAEDAYEDIYA